MNKEKGELLVDIEVNAPADAVWRAITEAEGIVSWFAPSAEVKSGLGGSVMLSWGPGMEGTAPITAWEPGKHFAWTEGADSDRPKVIDFTIETADGRSRLRVVQSGFSTGESFDAEVDSVHGGWHTFLAMLKHRVENHADAPCTHVWVFRFCEQPVEVLRERVAAATGVTAPQDGTSFTGRIGGESLSGRVIRAVKPGYACMAVDQWGGSTLALFAERAGPKSCFTTSAILFGDAMRHADRLRQALAALGDEVTA